MNAEIGRLVNLARANARLREGFLTYELLRLSDADPVSISRAGREVDRLAESLRVLSDLVEGG